MTLLVWFLKDSSWYFKLVVSVATALMVGAGFYYRNLLLSKRHIVIHALNEKIKNFS
jgi:hypothetical protein